MMANGISLDRKESGEPCFHVRVGKKKENQYNSVDGIFFSTSKAPFSLNFVTQFAESISSSYLVRRKAHVK